MIYTQNAISEAFTQLLQSHSSLVLATILSVDDMRRSAKAQRLDTDAMIRVRINPSLQKEHERTKNTPCFIPSEKSVILVGMLNENEGIMIQWGKLKRFNLQSQHPFVIKNDATSLKKVLQQLLLTIQNLSVLTPQGRSTGLDPASLQDIQNTTTKINQLLSE